jgi:SAM-dependent methyltransferase
MLGAAGLQPGMHVLDVAAGTGDQTIVAARIVGPSGSVLATDISESMLSVAAHVAREDGLTNVQTLVADAAALPLAPASFDAAICRFGLMFITDLEAALVRIREGLKPGARFATAVWSTLERNPWMGIQLATLAELGRPPGPLALTTSLGGDGLLAAALSASGFADVTVGPVETPRWFDSLDEAVAAVQSGSPAQIELVRTMTEADRTRYAGQLRRQLAPYEQADGRCFVPGEALVGSGLRS